MTDPNEIAQALADYTEKAYGFISVYKNPGPHSCDNLCLVTATARVLFPDLIPISRIVALLTECKVSPGVYVRYPGADPATQMCNHDDLTGIAVVGLIDAAAIARYGQSNRWTWPGLGSWPKGWLGRIIDFPATVKAAAGLDLSLLDCALWSAGITASCLTAHDNSSGKILAWLKIRAMEGKGNWLTKRATTFWRKRMQAMYPGGVRELLSVWYQDPGHPFRKYAKESFYE